MGIETSKIGAVQSFTPEFTTWFPILHWIMWIYPGIMVLGVLVKSFWRNSDKTCKPLSATWLLRFLGSRALFQLMVFRGIPKKTLKKSSIDPHLPKFLISWSSEARIKIAEAELWRHKIKIRNSPQPHGTATCGCSCFMAQIREST